LQTFKKSLRNNKALSISFINKFFSAGISIINVFFITYFFTPYLQGYYYIFNNLMMLNFLFDIGFGIVLVQFVSHEWARLSYDENGEVCGDENAKSRLATLVRLSIKWYIGVSIFFCLIIGIGGFFFIGLQHNNFIQFGLPWFLLILAVSFSILLSPIRSLLEGSNQIARNQTTLFLSTFGGAIVMWLSVYYNCGLYALSNGMAVTVIISFILLKKPLQKFFKFKDFNIGSDVSFWKREFKGQQLKIGASWLLGYFMLQSFVPMAFKLINPVEAGKIGATMQLFNLVNMVGMIWVNVVGPRFGTLGAKKEYVTIRKLAQATLKNSLLSSILIASCLLSIIYFARRLNLQQVERFSDLPTIILILLTAVVAQVSNVFTTVIRFQKKEPFLIPTVTCTVLQFILIFLLFSSLGIYTFSIVFFGIISLIWVPWTILIYKKYMNEFIQAEVLKRH